MYIVALRLYDFGGLLGYWYSYYELQVPDIEKQRQCRRDNAKLTESRNASEQLIVMHVMPIELIY